MSSLREKMQRDMTIRRFAPTTQESYIRAVAELAKHYMLPPDQLTEEQLRDYIHFLITERKLSCSSINVITAGLRFFYRETLEQNKMALAIPPKKNPKKLPEIFNHNELKRLFSCLTNQKHRVMLMTAYAGGLRISEVIHLRIKDIDSIRMVLRIESSKGEKDRYTILSQRLLTELRSYWKKYRPENLLFPSPIKDGPLERATPNLVFREAKKKANISKNVTFHSLRHTFATNLLESGVDIRTIQILLGHSSISSTAIYLHVARKNISELKSPLDLIDMSNVDRLKRVKS